MLWISLSLGFTRLSHLSVRFENNGSRKDLYNTIGKNRESFEYTSLIVRFCNNVFQMSSFHSQLLKQMTQSSQNYSKSSSRQCFSFRWPVFMMESFPSRTVLGSKTTLIGLGVLFCFCLI